MTARQHMTQRAEVERDQVDPELDVDDGGQPLPAEWETLHEALPCRLYSSAGQELTTEARLAVVEDIRLMVPVGSDVTERDRVVRIADRLDNTVLDRTLNIRSVLLKRDHLELLLTGVSA